MSEPFEIRYTGEAVVDLREIAVKTVAWTDNTLWADLMQQAEREDVVVTRDGHAVALLTPFNDDDLEWYAREHDPAFLTSIATARQQTAQGKTISHADFKKELGID